MYKPQMKYSAREEKQIKKKILSMKVTALDEHYSTSAISLDQALASVRGKTPSRLHSDLEGAVTGARDFFKGSSISVELERLPYNQAEYWFNRLDNAVQYLKSRGIDASWKNSGMMWAAIHKNKTDEQIFLTEMSSRKFFDACNKVGYRGGPEIEWALARGEIPVPAVEAVLIYEGGLGGRCYPAIAKGYQGKLHPDAQSIVDKFNSRVLRH